MSRSASKGRPWRFVLLLLFGAVVLARCRTLEPISPREAEDLLDRGRALETEEHLEEAARQYELALDSARSLGDAALVSRGANRLGALKLRLGDARVALELGDEALAAARGSKSPSLEAEALFLLGSVDYSLGRMREAMERFEQSSASAGRASDSEQETKASLQVAVVAITLEQSATARRALERAVASSRERGDRRSEAEAMRLSGQLHSYLGENQLALDQFDGARRLLEGAPDPALEATLLNSVAQVYADMGEPETALKNYREALAHNERLQLRRRAAATRLEVGRCLVDLGRTEEAQQELETTLERFEEIGNARLQADVLGELGRLDEIQGELGKALAHVERALALQTNDDDPRGRSYFLDEAGRLYRKLGRGEQARQSFQRAAELSARADDLLGEAQALYHLSTVERDRGDLLEAKEAIERSLALAESLRAKVASHDLRTSFFAAVHERYAYYVDLLLRLHEMQPERGFDGHAFEAAERARARTLVESLEESSAGIREGVDAKLLTQERDLRERISAAAREKMLLPPKSSLELLAKLDDEISRLSMEHDQLLASIRSQSPHYAELTEPRAATITEARSLLDEDTRLLSYSLGSERSYLFSVTRRGLSVHPLPPREEIERLARESYRELASPSGHDADATPSPTESLSRVLLGALDGLADSRRLVVVADGALSFVPFGALASPDESGLPLITRLEVARVPSVSVVPLLRRQRAGRIYLRRVAVAADPVYQARDQRIRATRARSSEGSLELPRLPASAREAHAIETLAPDGSVEVVTGLAASREWVETAPLRDFRVVHFATHGFVDDVRPELSGIALSLFGPNGEAQDGFLRLHDVYNLHLPVELVVLSACETGLGKQVRGEGLVGLVRGFFYAGASAVVASSWKVDDVATTELMKRFYQNLFEGKSATASLREAQMELRETGPFRDPYYWAAFELQGDWR